MDNFILKRDAALTPIIAPAKPVRNKTIAREASNFHKKKEITTGIAFCTEKIVTTAMIITMIINVIILPPVLFFTSTLSSSINQQRIVESTII
ncbi:MAG: hypothetical protein ACOYVJ_11280 [Nitrospirota bacterium]